MLEMKYQELLAGTSDLLHLKYSLILIGRIYRMGTIHYSQELSLLLFEMECLSNVISANRKYVIVNYLRTFHSTWTD